MISKFTKGWAATETSYGDWHLIPLNDLREHVLTAACWCKPTQAEDTPEVLLFTHHAADRRTER